MIPPKTHFEQVPLELVRRIVAEQTLREIVSEEDSEPTTESFQEDLLRSRTIDGEFPFIF